MRRILSAFLCFGLAGQAAYAQTPRGDSPPDAAFPSLDPDPRAEEYNRRVRNEAYSWQDLAEVALWASGAQLNAARDALNAAVRDLLASEDMPAAPRERAEFILTFMHRRFLRAYSAHQTRLDEIFASGRYNCVSSAVFYAILASAAGLEVRGVMTKDHAFAAVSAGAESIDVETTNPYGFDPGSRREFHDAFGQSTGFVYVPSRNYRDRASITRLELASLIFTNRISEMELRGRFGEAVPLASNRAALLANRTAPASTPFFSDPSRDLVDRVYNYGASLLNMGREQDALRWGIAAAERYPGDSRWPEFIFACLNNQFVKLLQARRYDEARTALGRYRGSLSRDQAGRLEALILDAELMGRLARMRGAEDAEDALRLLEASGHVLQAARLMEMRNFIVLKEAERRAKAEGSRAAIAYIEGAAARYGKNAKFDEALRVHRMNRVAELHNRFADLFNGRNYEEARRIIQTGLEEFPGNRQLLTDFNLAEQALERR